MLCTYFLCKYPIWITYTISLTKSSCLVLCKLVFILAAYIKTATPKRLFINLIFNRCVCTFSHMFSYRIFKLLHRFNIKVLLVVVGLIHGALNVIFRNIIQNCFNLTILNTFSLQRLFWSPFSPTLFIIAILKFMR